MTGVAQHQGKCGRPGLQQKQQIGTTWQAAVWMIGVPPKLPEEVAIS